MMSTRLLTVTEAESRLSEIRQKIDAAAQKCGRSPLDIKLLAVSKTFPTQMIATYLGLGQLDFGESYIQEARDKASELAGNPIKPIWHFIGHLQSNKAKYAAHFVDVLHSLDSMSLASELNLRAAALGKKIKVYLQVNVSGENTKSGMKPDELPGFLDQLSGLPSLTPEGLMTMPPFNPDPEVSRPHFAALRDLRDKYAPQLPGLSMGMSGDFMVAIEEGATIVRVGTALFGQRD